MIVRSHECVDQGFQMPFVGKSKSLFCTIFSASNYSAANDGAYMQFTTKPKNTSSTQVASANLYFSVYQYNISTAVQLKRGDSESQTTGLQALIFKKRAILERAFEAVDVESEGIIAHSVWSAVMQAVTKLKIRWVSMVPLLVPKEALTYDERIDYYKYLQAVADGTSGQTTLAGISLEEDTMVDAIYKQHKKLSAVFQFFDPYDSGFISREQFREGCEKLNSYLPDGQKITNCDKVIDMMNISQEGAVSVNEFYEMFRIIDARMSKGASVKANALGKADTSESELALNIGSTISFSRQLTPVDLRGAVGTPPVAEQQVWLTI